ncbi:hypothetical protein [Desulfotalea psychrophila]|uniref:hypothetical protein n=1 Tax=Desulfotalea psychrophila TaxID=84980 RepID=UPI00059E440D|nr:hypothetical protein [Desulfotalea psychrophila]
MAFPVKSSSVTNEIERNHWGHREHGEHRAHRGNELKRRDRYEIRDARKSANHKKIWEQIDLLLFAKVCIGQDIPLLIFSLKKLRVCKATVVHLELISVGVF